MLPTTLAEAQALLESIDNFLASRAGNNFSLVLCPPFVFIEEVAKILTTSHLAQQTELGAQDIAMQDEGALTGEISGPMLVKLGVRYVIIGHSERRWKLGESNILVNEKLKAALRNELTPIVCLGERTRDEGYEDFLRQQTMATFDDISEDEIGKCLIAYEPVWAISTTPGARPDTPQSALESMRIIREALVRPDASILYGGSVTPENAGQFLTQEEIAGILVGGASVRGEDFVKILDISSQ